MICCCEAYGCAPVSYTVTPAWNVPGRGYYLYTNIRARSRPSPQFPCSNHCEHPLLLAFKGGFLVRIDGHVTHLVQELAHEKSEVCRERRSFVGALKIALQQAIVLRTYQECAIVSSKGCCVCLCTFSQVISLRLPSHSHTVFFENEVVSGGTHMESGFYRFCETSMCMSTASVESTVREGFDASGRSVHTILDLWNVHHKCCESQLLKPLHPYTTFEIF